ncbi:MAG: CHAT domain-containing protein, partial [Bacteroidota bacterium]
MDARSYANFDLVIEQAGDKYRARVVNSPAGQAAVEFDTLFSRLEVENFVLRMGRPQRGMRRIDSSEMETIRNFGARLFQTVFSHEVYACYLRSLDDVLGQNKGLRIRLRIDVPQFHDLPWEYLYNRQVDQFLALSKDTPVVRYIELPYGTQALPVKTPMKILVMISSPEGYPPLDIEEEWKRLKRALQPLIERGQVMLKRLDRPTLSALQQELRRNEVHVFHFIGHGKYFEQQQDGMLLLEDEAGRGRPTSGQHLGAILHDHHTLRLVVLNACEGARTSAEDPY